MPKAVNVRVTSLDSELEFAIQPNTSGKQLFDQVCKTLGIREVWYFGLRFLDSKGQLSWLRLEKKLEDSYVDVNPRKVSAQDIKKEVPLQFKFRVEFFPEDVSEELIEDVTQKLFFLQVKEGIINDDVYCPPETAVLLASYAVQAKFGDYDKDTHKDGYLSNEKLLPKRVLDQHKLDSRQWEERISNWHSEHKNMLKEEAMMEYLKIAQDLEMYGVNYYDIKNKKGSDLWLGVDALGINVYEHEDRLTPKIGFPWSEIRNISFSEKKFIIKPIDRKSPDFNFYVPRVKLNKHILALCMGNHELFIRRRKPDTVEIQQMKTTAKDLRNAKRSEKAQFLREQQARLDAEKQRLELEEKMKKFEEDQKIVQNSLKKTEEGSKELAEKARKAEEETRRLEEIKKQIEEEKKKLEKIAAEDRERLAYEKSVANQRAEAMAAESARKAKEAQELAQQLEDARIKELEKNEEIKRLSEAAARAEEAVAMAEEAAAKAAEEARARAAEEAYQNNNLAEPQYEEGTDAGSSQLIDDETDEVPVTQEIDRVALAERNKRLMEQLKLLGNELIGIRDNSKDTTMDHLHAENVKQGRDKYKTLKQIRQGNTKKRVNDFEQL
ncbi:Radixin [Trichoplax sp. H2]|nr:Radixin [Trichoplax sp. H2]|eukprot:RDD46876.1 Radixin [Trichoplax sp. H2]